MNFCDRCGQSLESAERFCSNCGKKVSSAADTATAETTNKKPAEQRAEKQENERADEEMSTSSKPRKDRNWTKHLGISALVALVFLGGFFWWGNRHYTYEKTEESFVQALRDRDASALAKVVSGEPASGFNASEKTVHPFIDAFEGASPADIEDFIDYLRADMVESADPMLSIQSVGSKFLFFEDYRVIFPTFHVEMLADPEVSVYLQDEKVFDGSDKSSYIFGPLIPGMYEFTPHLRETMEPGQPLVEFLDDYDDGKVIYVEMND